MSKKETGTEVAVTSKNEIQSVKDLVGDMSGLVNVRSELLRIPRVKLTQKMSNVFGELAKEGEFASEVLGINYGPDVSVIPLCINESASLMDKETSQAICFSRDLIKNSDGVLCRDCPHNEYWNDWASKTPECKTSIDVVCLLYVDGKVVPDPIEMNFRKMNFKAGKAILNMVMRDSFGVPFGSAYKLTSKAATKDQYKYYVINDVVEKTQLNSDVVKSIIPIAKHFLDMKKRGMVETETVIKENPVVSPDAPVEDCPL